ncbi:MAG: hypothetical protein OXD46_06645 [Chloroflexi bacterium]|nr:hypothetical protein [Chloroflexota bacterium]
MSIRKLALPAATIGVATALAASPVYAHGFGERYDLPLPLNMFMIAAAAAVAASFVVIGLFVNKQPGEFRYPTLNLFAVPALGSVLRSKIFICAFKLLGVAVFLLLIATSLFGVNKPVENFSPTFVWIIWWVGMGYICALLGNFWMLVNPWRTMYEWVERFLASDDEDKGLIAYPEGWGVWPAVILFFIFAWLENVYTGAQSPFKLGLFILVYSAITWAGMLVFGKHVWLRRGEAFTVLFSLFARFSPTEIRTSGDDVCNPCDGCDAETESCVDCLECFQIAEPDERRFNLRPYAVGLATRGIVSASMAVFVILTLATVTFDGISETSAWLTVQDALHPVISPLPVDTFGTIDTLGLLVFPILFLSVFLGFSWVLRLFEGTSDSPVFDVAKVFILSLVPIALAYNIAHFIAYLAISGQGIIPLLSNPFGFGWDLFGTAGYLININIISVGFVWWVSIVAIVLGHILSVYIAHIISLRRMPTSAQAVKSQYPMLALMIIYTASSLWIIAQPIAS